MITQFEDIEEIVRGKPPGRIVVAAAQDDHVLQAIHTVYRKGYVSPILIGDKERMLGLADDLGIDIAHMTVIKEMDPVKCAEIAVNIINHGEADVLMKGMMQTADLLRAVLDREKGLRGGQLLSHIGLYQLNAYHKLLMVTDAGINIAPDLRQKADIIRNAVKLAQALGIEHPKVAVLAAVEVVNPAMPGTLDAAALTIMSRRGQLSDCIVDGPLAMDNAINREAAQQKHIISEVAGDADILLTPDIESGNILVKSLIFLNNARSCGIITGARVPLVVTSRAESAEAKYYSILLSLAIRAL